MEEQQDFVALALKMIPGMILYSRVAVGPVPAHDMNQGLICCSRIAVGPVPLVSLSTVMGERDPCL
jgi:hypothetical protein